MWFFAVASEQVYEGLDSTRLSALLVSWLRRPRACRSRAIVALVSDLNTRACTICTIHSQLRKRVIAWVEREYRRERLRIF